MPEISSRFIGPHDWVPVEIEPHRYSNTRMLTGYASVGRAGANPLHPVLIEDFESELETTFAGVSGAHQGALCLSRYHVKMPYWNDEDRHLPRTYRLVSSPQRLTTTSVSVILVNKSEIAGAELGFHFIGRHLPTLRERFRNRDFRGLFGNLGYFMTEGLIRDKFPWSHNVRYPEFALPVTPSHLGFYLFRETDSGLVTSTFRGAHPAAVGVTRDGRVEIIPRLSLNSYTLILAGKEFIVDAINDPPSSANVVVYTPGYQPLDDLSKEHDWWRFAPEVPQSNRINLFVANVGDGQRPVEQVLQLWQGRSPIPSFGAVLSFDRDLFLRALGDPNLTHLQDKQIRIEPTAGTNINRYAQIIGGLVPAVANGVHLLEATMAEQVREALRFHGNALSPIAECGRESRNFDLYLREPAGVLVETNNDQIGWVLFDGRHEMSIGASVVDVAVILRMLQDAGEFELKHAVFIDGGSAMKVYAVNSDGARADLQLLNRVAAGSRNRPGSDPDGLNLYSTLGLSLR